MKKALYLFIIFIISLNLYSYTDDEMSLAKALINRNEKLAIELLNEKRININARFEEGITLLMLAAKNNMCNIAYILIENGAEINDKDDEGWSALSIIFICCKK